MARKNAAPAILAAAQACLVEGNGDFEIGDLAKKAGVSEGLPYRYFGSKVGVIEAVIQDFYSRYHAVVNQEYDIDVGWSERERDRIIKAINFLYKDPLSPIVFGKLSQISESEIAMLTNQAQISKYAIRNIQHGIASGQLNPELDPEIANAAIEGAIRSCVTFALTKSTRPSKKLLADQIWALMAGALGVKE